MILRWLLYPLRAATFALVWRAVRRLPWMTLALVIVVALATAACDVRVYEDGSFVGCLPAAPCTDQ